MINLYRLLILVSAAFLVSSCVKKLPIPSYVDFHEGEQKWSFTGDYDTTEGRISLKQDVYSVTGTGSRELYGKVVGNKITGTWHGKMLSGPFAITISDDGKYLKGTWSFGNIETPNQYAWNFKRIGNPVPIDSSENIENEDPVKSLSLLKSGNKFKMYISRHYLKVTQDSPFKDKKNHYEVIKESFEFFELFWM